MKEMDFNLHRRIQSGYKLTHNASIQLILTRGVIYGDEGLERGYRLPDISPMTPWTAPVPPKTDHMPISGAFRSSVKWRSCSDSCRTLRLQNPASEKPALGHLCLAHTSMTFELKVEAHVVVATLVACDFQVLLVDITHILCNNFLIIIIIIIIQIILLILLCRSV